MHARSTTVNAELERIDAGIAHVRDEVMPALLGMEGCIGLSMMVDRGTGRCIVTTSWESEDAMRATSEMVRPLRDRAIELLGASDAAVDEWEIAYLHRDHASRPGACVRATWMQVSQDDMERAMDIYEMARMPAMEELQGFCSASLFVDRSTGRAVSSVAYDSPEAMENTRERAAELRATGAQEARADILDVAEFELALAHLRVPEMA